MLRGDDKSLDDIEKGNHIIQLTNPKGSGSQVQYDAQANPIIADFHQDRQSFRKALWSPYGSGTTSALVYEFLVAYPLMSVLPLTTPDSDGVYRIKMHSGIMRSTLRELLRGFWRTTEMMMPANYNIFYHTAKTAVVHDHLYNNFNGKRVHISGEIDFIGMDKSGAEKQIPSLSLDVVGINEPRVLKYNLIQELERRAGRYAPLTNPALVIREGNPPDRMDAGYADFGGLPDEAILGAGEPRIFGLKDQSEVGYTQTKTDEITKSDGTKGKKRSRAWWYPGGDTEYAANRHNLPDGYYDDMKNDPLNKRCANLYGIPSSSSDGEPVFDSFAEATHIDRSPLNPSMPGDQHMAVYDCDTQAGAFLARRRSDGGWLIVGDTPCQKRSPERFAYEIVAMCRKPELNIQNWVNSEWVSDPAGRNDAPRTAVPFFRQVEEVVNKELRISKTHTPLPWTMQDPKSRYEAANYVLNRSAPGSGKPFVQFHISAKRVIYAMGAYAFKDSEIFKFDKSNNAAATFGDCFTYFAQLLSEREDWNYKKSREVTDMMDEDLKNQQQRGMFDPLAGPPLF